MDLFRAACIIRADSPAISDGILAVDQGRIAWVGRSLDAPRGTLHDLGHVAILPGLINAHTHLELTSFEGRIRRQPLWTWFDELLKLIRTSNFSSIGPDAIKKGAAQSLCAGVTCVADISRTGINVAALRDSPIRKVCFLELISGAMLPPNDAESLRAAVTQALAHQTEDILRIGISPHAPYTVSKFDLHAATHLALAWRLPIMMHFLESPEEADWLEGRGDLSAYLLARKLPTAHEEPPISVVAFLGASNLLATKPILAHVNYPPDTLVPLLADSGASVVFCPRAHDYFGHSPHRWRDLLAAGINVCLGTDSLASNESLSILDEMRFLARKAPGVESIELLRMGTVRAANALGMSDVIGDLQPGLMADFVTIPCDKNMAAIECVLQGDASVTGTWIAGHQVYSSAT
ncbi:MAG: amidohydrolase family protein [Planctomycetes bacterium]|nr:amidohydrolase family protein [Planctomycetota bacterium]